MLHLRESAKRHKMTQTSMPHNGDRFRAVDAERREHTPNTTQQLNSTPHIHAKWASHLLIFFSSLYPIQRCKNCYASKNSKQTHTCEETIERKYNENVLLKSSCAPLSKKRDTILFICDAMCAELLFGCDYIHWCVFFVASKCLVALFWIDERGRGKMLVSVVCCAELYCVYVIFPLRHVASTS